MRSMLHVRYAPSSCWWKDAASFFTSSGFMAFTSTFVISSAFCTIRSTFELMSVRNFNGYKSEERQHQQQAYIRSIRLVLGVGLLVLLSSSEWKQAAWRSYSLRAASNPSCTFTSGGLLLRNELRIWKTSSGTSAVAALPKRQRRTIQALLFVDTSFSHAIVQRKH